MVWIPHDIARAVSWHTHLDRKVPTVNIEPVEPYITHITNLSGAHIFAQCAVCGDDLAIHEWVDIDNRTGYEIDCDRK